MATVKKAAADKKAGAFKPSVGRNGKVLPLKAADVAMTKAPKPKLIRDGFTIPVAEFQALADLKARAIGLKRPAKKSEVLRAGIMALSKMTDRSFLMALAAVPPLKTGRPKS